MTPPKTKLSSDKHQDSPSHFLPPGADKTGIKYYTGFLPAAAATDTMSPSDQPAEAAEANEHREVRFRILLHATILAPPWRAPPDKEPSQQEHHSPDTANTLQEAQPMVVFNQRLQPYLSFCVRIESNEGFPVGKNLLAHNVVNWSWTTLFDQRNVLQSWALRDDHKDEHAPALPTPLQHPFLSARGHTQEHFVVPEDDSYEEAEAAQMSQRYHSLPLSERISHFRTLEMYTDSNSVAHVVAPAAMSTAHITDMQILSMAYVDLVVPTQAGGATWLYWAPGVDCFGLETPGENPQAGETKTWLEPFRFRNDAWAPCTKLPPYWTKTGTSEFAPRQSADVFNIDRTGPNPAKPSPSSPAKAETAHARHDIVPASHSSCSKQNAAEAKPSIQSTVIRDCSSPNSSILSLANVRFGASDSESSDKKEDTEPSPDTSASTDFAKADNPSKTPAGCQEKLQHSPSGVGLHASPLDENGSQEAPELPTITHASCRLGLPTPPVPRRSVVCVASSWGHMFAFRAFLNAVSSGKTLPIPSGGSFPGSTGGTTALMRALAIQEHTLALGILNDARIALEGHESYSYIGPGVETLGPVVSEKPEDEAALRKSKSKASLFSMRLGGSRRGQRSGNDVGKDPNPGIEKKGGDSTARAGIKKRASAFFRWQKNA